MRWPNRRARLEILWNISAVSICLTAFVRMIFGAPHLESIIKHSYLEDADYPIYLHILSWASVLFPLVNWVLYCALTRKRREPLIRTVTILGPLLVEALVSLVLFELDHFTHPVWSPEGQLILQAPGICFEVLGILYFWPPTIYQPVSLPGRRLLDNDLEAEEYTDGPLARLYRAQPPTTYRQLPLPDDYGDQSGIDSRPEAGSDIEAAETDGTLPLLNTVPSARHPRSETDLPKSMIFWTRHNSMRYSLGILAYWVGSAFHLVLLLPVTRGQPAASYNR